MHIKYENTRINSYLNFLLPKYTLLWEFLPLHLVLRTTKLVLSYSSWTDMDNRLKMERPSYIAVSVRVMDVWKNMQVWVFDVHFLLIHTTSGNVPPPCRIVRKCGAFLCFRTWVKQSENNIFISLIPCFVYANATLPCTAQHAECISVSSSHLQLIFYMFFKRNFCTAAVTYFTPCNM